MQAEEIRTKILERLRRRRLWGGKHTSIDNIPKGFLPHKRKDVICEVKDLIKEGLVIQKATSYGLEVSLNPRGKERIYSIIDELRKEESFNL